MRTFRESVRQFRVFRDLIIFIGIRGVTMSGPAWLLPLFEAYGGKDAFFKATEAQLADFNAVWQQDIHAVGRVVSAHTVLEFFLTQYLQAANPGLGPLGSARLTYFAKVSLIHPRSSAAFLVPGLRCVGSIRNRLAHNLNAGVTEKDRDELLSIPLYAAVRAESAKRGPPRSHDPIQVYEHFAQFAASIMNAAADPNVAAWAESVRLFAAEKFEAAATAVRTSRPKRPDEG